MSTGNQDTARGLKFSAGGNQDTVGHLTERRKVKLE